MHAKTVIGIDVGGTKISVGRVSGGKVVAGLQHATDAGKGAKHVLDTIITLTKKLWTADVTAIGVGIAGVVDHKKGVFVGGPNLPKDLKNTPLVALLKRRFKVPVTIDNDVHCFTLAEAKLGSAKRFSHIVGLTFGTGIGGGIVLNGELYRGRNNAAGEFGHTVVSLGSTAQCGCGKTGHFEAYGSGTAMSNLYFTLTKKRLTPLQIEQIALRGDKKAKQVLAVMTDALAAGLANIIHSLNPDVIVLGGGLTNIKTLWRPITTKIRALVVSPKLGDTPIVFGSLGANAGVLGAALLTEK